MAQKVAIPGRRPCFAAFERWIYAAAGPLTLSALPVTEALRGNFQLAGTMDWPGEILVLRTASGGASHY